LSQKASALGINTFIGFSFSHNEPSLKLFYGYGFESWGHLPKVDIFNGIERDLTILGKRVC